MSKVSTHTFSIDAGDQQLAGVAGDYIYLKNSPVDITVEIDNRAYVTMSKGDKLRIPAPKGELHGFNAIRLINESGTDAVITAIIGSGDFTESSIANDVDVSKGTTLATTADQSVTAASTELIAASDTTRRVVMVCNLSSSVTLRIGDSNAGAAQGQPLAPGLTLTLETTAAVYAYNPDAGAVSVAVTELKD